MARKRIHGPRVHVPVKHSSLHVRLPTELRDRYWAKLNGESVCSHMRVLITAWVDGQPTTTDAPDKPPVNKGNPVYDLARRA